MPSSWYAHNSHVRLTTRLYGMLFYPLYYGIISLISLKITQAFQLLLGFAENQVIFLDFKIQNSVRITKGSDNRDLDYPGSTVLCSMNESNTKAKMFFQLNS